MKVKHGDLKDERARLLASGNALFIENSRLNEELRAQIDRIEQRQAEYQEELQDRDTIIEALQRELEEREVKGAPGQ